MVFISNVLLGGGCLLMLWGTLNLLRKHNYVVKLHVLGISDTLGAMLIVAALIFRFPDRIFPLGTAFAALLFWGPLITFVLAKGLHEGREWGEGR